MSERLTLPNLLLIGSQKSATTSLADDLATAGLVTLGRRKEPDHLAAADLDNRTLRSYRRNFDFEVETDHLLDASTTLSMRTLHPHAASNALSVLGNDLKLIYIIRHPFERMVSHHRHEAARELMSPVFDEAIEDHPELLTNGLYHWQLEPWLECFGGDRIAVITMDDYLGSRRDVMERLARFLDTDIGDDVGGSIAPRLNVAGGTQFATKPAVRRVVQSKFYNDRIRDVVPIQFKQRIARRLLQTELPTFVGPSAEKAAELRHSMDVDLAALRRLSVATGTVVVPESWTTA